MGRLAGSLDLPFGTSSIELGCYARTGYAVVSEGTCLP